MITCAVVIAATSFCASGFGSFLLLGAAPPIVGRWRALVAEYLIGFFAYSALFGIAAHLRVPFAAAIVLALAFALVGVLCATGLARWRSLQSKAQLRGELARRVAIALALGVLLFSLVVIKGNPAAADPRHYAYLAATVFQDSWVDEIQVPADAHKWMADLRYLALQSRAPVAATVWPVTALGWGVDAATVTRVGAWLLLVSVALLTDTLYGFAPWWTRVLLAGASVGLFNAMSILYGGQINQTMGLVVVVGLVWICRVTAAARPRFVALALAGNVVAAAYPEFLLAIPLYFGCVLALGFVSWRRTVSEIAALAIGAIVAELSTGFIRQYLIRQSSTVPLWSPLASTPHGLRELWSIVLLQRSEPMWLFVSIFTVAAVGVWYRTRRPVLLTTPLTARWSVVVGVCVMISVWSWATFGSGNANYAAFKLASWLGPGLMLLTWTLSQSLRPRAAVVIGAAVLMVAVSRGVDLVREVPGMMGSGLWGPVAITETPLTGRCVVRSISERRDVILRAVSESGAAARGCAFTVERASFVASLYDGKPPRGWRSNESKAYVIGVENASATTWETDGPTGVHLGVRFEKPGAKAGQWTLVALPGPISPGVRRDVQVEVAAPQDKGRYVIEHRLVQAQTWSQQALRVKIAVD